MATMLTTTTATMNPEGQITNVTRSETKKMSERAVRAQFTGLAIPQTAEIVLRDDTTVVYTQPDQFRAGWLRRTTVGIRWGLSPQPPEVHRCTLGATAARSTSPCGFRAAGAESRSRSSTLEQSGRCGDAGKSQSGSTATKSAEYWR